MRFLFVQQRQFGYLKDTYEWAKNFVDEGHIVHIVCYDNGLKKLEQSGVNVTYVKFTKGSRIENNWQFMKMIRNLESQNHFDWLILEYFSGCSLLLTISKTVNIHLDIRTASVRANTAIRKLENFIISVESKFFGSVSVIDEIIGQNLSLKKAKVIPLGADRYVSESKSFEAINLLYVGTLNHRRIIDTVRGFCSFYDKYGRYWETPPVYHIIGDGYGTELEEMRQYVIDSKCESSVFVHGRKDGVELLKYWEICNIGVSFIPKKVGFDDQVPTKTLEYIKNGMFCLATSTRANKQVLRKVNSKILLEDNALDFERSLIKLRSLKNSGVIVDSSFVPDWKEVSNSLLAYVKRNS